MPSSYTPDNVNHEIKIVPQLPELWPYDVIGSRLKQGILPGCGKNCIPSMIISMKS